MIKYLLIFVVLLICARLVAAQEISPATLIVESRQGNLVIRAQGTPLAEILEEIERQCAVEILGLEDRKNDPVTFLSQWGTIEEEIKRFLHHLGEKNYAFEFVQEKLRRVLIFPEAKLELSPTPPPVEREVPSAPPTPEKKVEPTGFVTVPQVKKVLEGHQAESLDLLEGDLIVEYDGVKIRTAQQLVRETKGRKEDEKVEMVVVRDGEPLILEVRGGLIGVEIENTTVPKKEFEEYLSEE